MTRLLPLPLLFLGFILQSACVSMNPEAEKSSYCRMLKSQIVFSGATSVTRDANIDLGEEDLQQHNFDAADCEKY